MSKIQLKIFLQVHVSFHLTVMELRTLRGLVGIFNMACMLSISVPVWTHGGRWRNRGMPGTCGSFNSSLMLLSQLFAILFVHNNACYRIDGILSVSIRRVPQVTRRAINHTKILVGERTSYWKWHRGIIRVRYDIDRYPADLWRVLRMICLSIFNSFIYS